MPTGRKRPADGLTTANGEVKHMILEIAAVSSCCLFAYMVPVVAYIVWRRRRKDKTEIIQELDAEDFVNDEL